MRDLTGLDGVEQLEMLEKYAKDSLEESEGLFVEEVRKKIGAFSHEDTNELLTLCELEKLTCLWAKYHHLRIFKFQFNPKEKMPEIFENKVAFIIWAMWRVSHLLGEEDLKRAALVAAKTLSFRRAPYSLEAKGEAVRKFVVLMEEHGCLCDYYHARLFWDENIFPFLEGKWKFRFEVITN